MASTVRYTDKSGKPAAATFPTRALAEGYARTVKNARIEDTAFAAVAPVEVKRCPEGTAEAQRQASRHYHDSWRNDSSIPVGSTRPAQEDTSENEAERMAEHFGAARCAGQSMEDAWADWDYSRGLGPDGPSKRRT